MRSAPADQGGRLADDRASRCLQRVTAALDARHIPYAIVGASAVAAWLARADPKAAMRSEQVDILVRRSDAALVERTFLDLGLLAPEVHGPFMIFPDPTEPGPRTLVRLVFAGELVRQDDDLPAPLVDDVDPGFEGVRVIAMPALVAMKLIADGPDDHAHLVELLMAGAIPPTGSLNLTPTLAAKLEAMREVAREEVDRALRDNEDDRVFVRILGLGSIVLIQLIGSIVAVAIDLAFLLGGHPLGQRTAVSTLGIVAAVVGLIAILGVGSRPAGSGLRLAGAIGQALVAGLGVWMLSTGRVGGGATVVASAALAIAAIYLPRKNAGQSIKEEMDRRLHGRPLSP